MVVFTCAFISDSFEQHINGVTTGAFDLQTQQNSVPPQKNLRETLQIKILPR